MAKVVITGRNLSPPPERVVIYPEGEAFPNRPPDFTAVYVGPDDEPPYYAIKSADGDQDFEVPVGVLDNRHEALVKECSKRASGKDVVVDLAS